MDTSSCSIWYIYKIHIDVCVCFVIPPQVLASPNSLNHICKHTKSQVVRVSMEVNEVVSPTNIALNIHQLNSIVEPSKLIITIISKCLEQVENLLPNGGSRFVKWQCSTVHHGTIRQRSKLTLNKSKSSTSIIIHLIIIVVPMSILCFPAKTQLTRCQNGVALCHWDLRFLLAPAE